MLQLQHAGVSGVCAGVQLACTREQTSSVWHGVLNSAPRAHYHREAMREAQCAVLLAAALYSGGGVRGRRPARKGWDGPRPGSGRPSAQRESPPAAQSPPARPRAGIEPRAAPRRQNPAAVEAPAPRLQPTGRCPQWRQEDQQGSPHACSSTNCTQSSCPWAHASSA